MEDYSAFAPHTLGATAARAAEALLRSLGDGKVTLRILLPEGAAGGGLGLAAPQTEEVELWPAMVRLVAPGEDGGARYEVAIAGSSVVEEAEKRNHESADEFLAAALGVVLGEKLLRIVNATPHSCGGKVYLYRLEARG
ncbi:MAG TPA: hypothetical protein VLA96_11065 [Terriglobales bacterium]|nr:hypothetical protein [Terriglobales bacterium]